MKRIAMAAATLLLTTVVFGQTADEIIHKHVQARGGLEKLKTVKTLKQSGATYSSQADTDYVKYMKRPAMVRIDMNILGAVWKRGYDGKTAWGNKPVFANSAIEETPPEQAKDIIASADLDGLLVDYQDKGSQVELAGKESLDGTEAFKLLVTRKDGDVVEVYLDSTTYLVAKTSRTTKMGEQEQQVETYFSEYREVGGLQFPFLVDTHMGGQSVNRDEVDSIQLNLELADSLFTVSAAAAKK